MESVALSHGEEQDQPIASVHMPKVIVEDELDDVEAEGEAEADSEGDDSAEGSSEGDSEE